MKYSNEVELGEQVVAYLEERQWTVYQEVSALGRTADIVAVMDGRVWTIECKLSFSLRVLEQAVGWRRYSHWVSVAVPTPSAARAFNRRVAAMFGCGVLGCSLRHEVVCREYVPAHLLRKAYVEPITKHLDEKMRTFAKAGNASGKRWTPFMRTCSNITEYVRRNPGCTLKQLLDNIPHHYASRSSARSSLSYWLRMGKVPGVVCSTDGHLTLRLRRLRR